MRKEEIFSAEGKESQLHAISFLHCFGTGKKTPTMDKTVPGGEHGIDLSCQIVVSKHHFPPKGVRAPYLILSLGKKKGQDEPGKAGQSGKQESSHVLLQPFRFLSLL